MNSLETIKNPYLLLTPGPLSTTQRVKSQMLRDWCTWDDDYNSIVQTVRQTLVDLATTHEGYTCTLMQGSGTASVEATIGSTIPSDGKLVVLSNGEYGKRIAQIARRLHIDTLEIDSGEMGCVNPEALESVLQQNPDITHVAVVHCETTTGMMNPLEAIGQVVKAHDKVFVVDAMSSFGGIAMDIGELDIDFMISSANKCIQGVPGFGFVLAKRSRMEAIAGWGRSVSLDLYDQWQCMENHGGKWRFTSPTHVVRAFAEALKELASEGGVDAREIRYRQNQQALVQGMCQLGFITLLPNDFHSPIITSFYSPDHLDYDFKRFYDSLKALGFVIYPGKVSNADCFRIGNIGDIHLSDIHRLITAVKASMYWQNHT